MADTAICTWFVADNAETATFFPQVGSSSDAPKTQATYWRCAVCFFASSLALNPDRRHFFFTNTQVPVIDGIDLAQLYASWGVEVIQLPITYRLPTGSIGSWGNQFYIFDVLEWFVSHAPTSRVIVLDSDCLWLQPVGAMESAIDEHGALTYELGDDEHSLDSPINGLSRQAMANFLKAHGGPSRQTTPYFGGEIYAAGIATTRQIANRARTLWADVAAQSADAPREEAHLLSIIYALEGIPAGTANAFIRRMWTTFHHHNLAAPDRDLTIWHLPAEKKTGFADMFARIAVRPDIIPAQNAGPLGLDFECYARDMGWPRRSYWKFVRDLSLKLKERLSRAMAAGADGLRR